MVLEGFIRFLFFLKFVLYLVILRLVPNKFIPFNNIWLIHPDWLRFLTNHCSRWLLNWYFSLEWWFAFGRGMSNSLCFLAFDSSIHWNTSILREPIIDKFQWDCIVQLNHPQMVDFECFGSQQLIVQQEQLTEVWNETFSVHFSDDVDGLHWLSEIG